MRVTVVRPGELGESEAALWAKYQGRSPLTLNPFLSLTFAKIVGRARTTARVALIENDGQIQAFLPFEHAAHRIAMPIGWPMNNFQGLLSSGAPLDARSIVRAAGLRGWRFIAPTDQPALAPHYYAESVVRCQVINLSHGYQAYCQDLSRHLIKDTDRRRRGLERELGDLTVDWHSPTARDLQQLFDWKSRRYGEVQRLFSELPSRRIVEELTNTRNADCTGVLSVIRTAERPIAMRLWINGPAALCGWFTAFDTDLARFSPGKVMSFALAEEAAQQGITRIDLGPGQEPYKFELANDSYPVAGGAVWAWRLEGSARAAFRRLISQQARRPVASDNG